MKEALQNLGFVSSEKAKELSYTITDSQEENVWPSPHKYWCFIEDEMLENYYSLRLLTPYCNYFEGKMYYGCPDRYVAG